MCNIVWRLSDNIPQGFYSCNVAPIVLLSSALFSGVSRTTLHVVLVVQFCPRSIKTVLIRIFFCAISFETSRTTMHKILFLWKFVEPQRQRYIEFFVQYYFNSLLRQCWIGFFSSAMLPGASYATLPWIFVCLMLSQEYYDNIKSCAILFGVSRAVLHRVFQVQGCHRSIKTTLYRTFPRAMLSGASQTKLQLCRGF